MPTTAPSIPGSCHPAVEARLRRVIAVHFDPDGGTPFWLDRAASLGIDPIADVRSLADLAVLGDMHPADLEGRPLVDFIPRRLHPDRSSFVVGQTGGTTGGGAWTGYRADEFREAFVDPFSAAARRVGFPTGETWLYVGPSGPHVIGTVTPHLARAMDSPDPFSVDFDPRWAKKLAEGSFGRKRYLEHVTTQAMDVIQSQPVGVLFTTPVVLDALAARMDRAQRERIRGVHYGGMALAPDDLHAFQTRHFPGAVHLSGYGNTLFGCCLELDASPGRRLDYYPRGERLVLEVVDDDGAPLPPGTRGRVRFTRLDESFLVVRMLERDGAELIAPPTDAPEGFVLPGLRDPSPSTVYEPRQTAGLY